MMRLLDLSLRLTIWFLLTADGSPANLIIGVCVALLLPSRPQSLVQSGAVIRDGLQILVKILLAIPQAYWEAIEMILYPHKQEAIALERVKSQRTAGLIFLDIFLITFTPKTIVVKYHEAGWYEVHRVERRGGRRGSL